MFVLALNPVALGKFGRNSFVREIAHKTFLDFDDAADFQQLEFHARFVERFNRRGVVNFFMKSNVS